MTTKAIDASTPKGEAERLSAALAEGRALRAWKKAGSKGRKPSQVNTNAIKRDEELHGPRSQRKQTSTRSTSTKVDDGCVIARNGVPMNRNSLSYAAWHATAGIGGAARIGVDELRVLLQKKGVKQPETTTWSVELPNGVVLSRGTPAEVKKHAPAKSAAKPAAKRSTAKKPAAKKTAAKKTTKRTSRKAA